MKRLILFLSIFICSASYGADTCIVSDLPMFKIQKSMNPTALDIDSTNKTFKLRYPSDIVPGQSDNAHRTLRGAATCNAINTDTNDEIITPNAANTHLRAGDDDTGVNCWCRLAGPLTSWWVFLKTYDQQSTPTDNSTDCAANCTIECANAIAGNTGGFRINGIYNAIW